MLSLAASPFIAVSPSLSVNPSAIALGGGGKLAGRAVLRMARAVVTGAGNAGIGDAPLRGLRGGAAGP